MRIIPYGGCLAACLISLAQAAPPPTPDTASCHHFVQSFYNWYVPPAQKITNEPPSNLALRQKADAFTADLLHALRVDADASAHAKGDLVGLDFDPFLSSQDPATHYDVRAATWRNNKCSVEIWSTSPTDTADKSRKPDVIADLTLQQGHWKFQNFRYPELNTDLLTVLANLRQERQKAHAGH
jgi:hypothetical protein